jgi:RND family efflux transporter MFP subunit
MTDTPRMTVNAVTAVVIAIALMLTGGAVTYLLMRNGAAAANRSVPPAEAVGGTSAPTAAPAAGSSSAGAAPLPDVTITVTREAAARAGIAVGSVSARPSTSTLRLPGTVEPNAYRKVTVTPLVGGRITRVSAELGDRVRRGQTLAEIYSPELAEARTRYVSARAMLDAHDLELKRTEKLVEIGAASRQELERIHAEHASQTADVQSARARLELLGVPASTLDSPGAEKGASATSSVPAPIDGTVTERAANPGLNVEASTGLFTVADLSTVWVVASAYERDLSRVRVGEDAAVTTPAYPGRTLRGRVSYIDPQVNPDTRTAQVRVEVSNARGELRLGMYADVVVAGVPGTPMPTIPRSAVQHVGDRTVVYLASTAAPDTFVEREVRLGESSGDGVAVTAGIQPGDTVVTAGSFFVRAERERLGLRAPAPAAPAARPATAPSSEASGDARVQSARILVNEQGYDPPKLQLRAGTPARLTFVRTTDKTCGTEVVFPSLNIKRALPLNQPIDIEFTPETAGEIAFACGMNMLKGTVVVQ